MTPTPREEERQRACERSRQYLNAIGITDPRVLELIHDPTTGRNLDGSEGHPGWQYFSEQVILLAKMLQVFLHMNDTLEEEVKRWRRRTSSSAASS